MYDTSNGTLYYNRIIVPKGTHTLDINYTTNFIGSNYYTELMYVNVTELDVSAEELNNKFLTTQGEAQIEWDNDSVYPMSYNDDLLRTPLAYWENMTSGLKAKISLEKPAIISFDWKVGKEDSRLNHIGRFYIDGCFKASNYYKTSWVTNTVALDAGEHTLQWVYSCAEADPEYYLALKDLKIESDMVEVETTPGYLGYETLFKVDRLQDVKLLKIKGGMDSDDWQTIQQMTNLYGLDLSEAEITSIPAKFYANPEFSYIVLPETLEEIPDDAFAYSRVHSITIPASVKRIGSGAFFYSYLRKIDFAENSQLKSIDYSAFRNTYIEEFIMPNSVTELGTVKSNTGVIHSSAFASCYNLKKIVFSDSLTYLPQEICAYSRQLEEVVLPKNLKAVPIKFMYMDDNTICALKTLKLPDTVTSIGEEAFYNVASLKDMVFPESLTNISANAFSGTGIKSVKFPESLTSIGDEAFRKCPMDSVLLPGRLQTLGQYAFADNSALKFVRLPSAITDYDYQFSGCPSIQRIECQAATPPTIINDPFEGLAKGDINLRVPYFAIPTYKLDSYWYQFGLITEGNSSDYWKIVGDLKLVGNRRMAGSPDVDLYYGGALTVKGNDPLSLNKFDIYTSETNPASYVSDCPNVSANEINIKFDVYSNRWYFLTVPADVDLNKISVDKTQNYVFRYYDADSRAANGKGNSWKNKTETKLRAGQGYIFQCDAASTITFPVDTDQRMRLLTTEDISISLSEHKATNTANSNWNYIGNPYPSYYDIYYLDFPAPITIWTGSTYKAYSITDDDFILRPMQAFFVQKPEAADAINFPSAGRQNTTAIKRPSKPSRLSDGSDINRHLFNLVISDGNNEDDTRVVLNENASLGYEIERDAAKFMSIDENVPQIYSIDSSGNKFAINERPIQNGDVALGIFIPDASATYYISASRIDGCAAIFDAETKTTHDLANGEYIFSASKGYNNERFTLLLGNSSDSTLTANPEGIAISVIGGKGFLDINGAEGHRFRLYDIDGKLLNDANLSAENRRHHLSPGLYVVIVSGESYKVVVR